MKWFQPSSPKGGESFLNLLPYEELVTRNGKTVLVMSDGSFVKGYTFDLLHADTMGTDTLLGVENSLRVAFNTCPYPFQIYFTKSLTSDLKERHLENCKKDALSLYVAEDRINSRAQNYSLRGAIFYRIKPNVGDWKSISAEKNIQVWEQTLNYIFSEVELQETVFRTGFDAFSRFRECTEEDFKYFLAQYWGDELTLQDSPMNPLRAVIPVTEVEHRGLYLYSPPSLSSLFTLTALPPETWMTQLAHVFALEMPMSITVNCKTPNQNAVKDRVRTQFKRYRQLADDPSAEVYYTFLGELIRELETGTGKILDAEFYFRVKATDKVELQKYCSALKGALEGSDFKAFQERDALLDLTIKAAPCHCYPDGYRNLRVLSENLADLAPLIGPLQDSDTPAMIFDAPYGAAFGYNLFDPRLSASHGMVIGATGAGKSFLMNSLLTSHMFCNPQVFIVDRGGSYKRTTELMGGIYVDVGEQSFNPLAPLIPERMEVMKTILAEMAGVRTPHAYIVLERLLTDLMRSEQNVTLSDAWKLLDSRVFYDEEKEGALASVQNELRIGLSRWTWAGSSGHSSLAKYVDNPQSMVELENRFVTFDLTATDGNEVLSRVMFYILSDLISRKVRSFQGGRKLIIFDEAWAVVNTPEGSALLTDLYKTMRKFNCAVFTVSQSLEDFSNGTLAGVLVSQTYQTFILRQNTEPDIQLIGKILGLGEAELNSIRNLRSVKGKYSSFFLSLKGLGSTTLKYSPCSSEYWLATTDPEDRKVFDSYHKTSLPETLKALKERKEVS